MNMLGTRDFVQLKLSLAAFLLYAALFTISGMNICLIQPYVNVIKRVCQKRACQGKRISSKGYR